ncbi:MAG: hypothetical protein PHH06_03120 [Candidatus Gracilibacteria bacterium]|nr:hypothetical protein [Candidatus Gracilibacteria bacterium]
MIIKTVNALSTSSPIFGQNMEFGDFVLLIISLFVITASVLSIFFILYGGVLLILSGGKEDKIKPAVNTIRYAVLGIVITVISIFVFPILGRLLGIDVEKYAQPSRILEKIEQIGNNIFGSTSSSYTVPRGTYDSVKELPSDFSDL